MSDSANRRIVIGAVLAFAVLRLIALTRYPLWTDETWTLQTGGGSLRTLLRLHADDQTHPPFFYALLWLWRRFTPDVFEWQRLFPALAGIATAVPLVALARRAGFTSRGVILGAIVGAGSGILVAYSAELRSYAFLALLGTASLAVYLRERDAEAPRWATLTVINILLVYSHYFGVFVVIAEVVDAAIGARSRLRGVFMSATLTALSLVPWGAETIRRARIVGARLEVVSWIQVPKAGDTLDMIRESVGGLPSLAADYALAIAIAALIAAWLIHARRADTWRGTRLIALAVLVPIGIAWLESVAGPKPIWVPRYLIAVAPPLALLFAGAIDWAIPKRATAIGVAIALIPGVLTVLSMTRGRLKPRYDLAMDAIAAHEGGRPVDAYTLKTADAFPVLYRARAMAKREGREVIRTDDLIPDSSIPAAEGWLIWNEVHPPRGITPTARLVRQGYRVGPVLGFGSDLDSLVVVRFARASRR